MKKTIQIAWDDIDKETTEEIEDQIVDFQKTLGQEYHDEGHQFYFDDNYSIGKDRVYMTIHKIGDRWLEDAIEFFQTYDEGYEYRLNYKVRIV
jgi:hypothetical protein